MILGAFPTVRDLGAGLAAASIEGEPFVDLAARGSRHAAPRAPLLDDGAGSLIAFAPFTPVLCGAQ
jgi:hypothetical protein